MSKEPIVNLPFKYINGMQLSWASNTTLTMASGQCRDSTNTYDLVLPLDITIDANSVGYVNGLDTGSFSANTCYAIYVIGDSRGFKAVGGLISTALVPVLPSGYDIYRRIGWAFSDSNPYFILFYMHDTGSDRKITFDSPIQIINAGASATFLAVDLTNIVPVMDNLSIQLQCVFTAGAGSDEAWFRSGGSSSAGIMMAGGSDAGIITTQEINMLAKLVSGMPEIEYKVPYSGSISAYLVSFTDNIA